MRYTVIKEIKTKSGKYVDGRKYAHFWQLLINNDRKTGDKNRILIRPCYRTEQRYKDHRTGEKRTRWNIAPRALTMEIDEFLKYLPEIAQMARDGKKLHGKI